MFIGLITGLVNASNHTKCMPLSNFKCKTEPTVINLHPNEYSQELNYYPFIVKLDQCVKSWNNLNDLPNELCVPNKTEGLYLKLSNMITGITESKTLKKYISCEYKCRFDARKCNSN